MHVYPNDDQPLVVTHLNSKMKIEPKFGLGASDVASNDEASREEDTKCSSHQKSVEVEVAEPLVITAHGLCFSRITT